MGCPSAYVRSAVLVGVSEHLGALAAGSEAAATELGRLKGAACKAWQGLAVPGETSSNHSSARENEYTRLVALLAQARLSEHGVMPPWRFLAAIECCFDVLFVKSGLTSTRNIGARF